MIHPSYVELMKVVNNTTEVGEEPVVNSRYSIVIAAAKRARRLIAGEGPVVGHANGKKPRSTAVQELYEGKVKILGEDESADDASAVVNADLLAADVIDTESATAQAEE